MNRFSIFVACITTCFALSLRAGVLTVTSNTDSGSGSLRAAIAFASPGDTIDFAVGIGSEIQLNSELIVDKNLTITGPGITNLTLRGRNTGLTTRVLNVTAGAVSISGLRFSEGSSTNGGLVYNSGSLALSNCTLVTGDARPINADAAGGAIYNSGALTLEGCTLSGNDVFGHANGYYGWASGGGIFNIGTLMINRCTFSGNRVIGVNTNSFAIRVAGGGLHNGKGGNATVQNSTFFANSTATLAGNIFAYGGAIFNESGSGTSLSLTSCTIVGNASASGGGLSSGQITTIRNCVIATNISTNSSCDCPDLNGAVQSSGFNLIGTTNSNYAFGNWQSTDQVGSLANPINPLIGLLQNNGGPTMTMALFPNSPAIDAGSSSGLTTDQRGVQRSLNDLSVPDSSGGDGSDIGAFELGYTLTTNVVGAGGLSVNPYQGVYPPNSSVQLTANPSPGWGLIWSGDASGTANPLTVVMTTNKSITAVFFQPTLIASANPGGTVIKSPDQITQAYGSTATLTAVPLVGHAFVGWSGAATGTQNPLPVLMTSSKTIAANFTPIVSDLIVDNTNAAFTGSWTAASGSGGNDFFAADFRYANTVASETATASFCPTIPLTGNYDVYVWFPSVTPGAQRCSDAQYFVSASSSNQTVSVDQSAGNAGSWQLIATSRKFSQGTNGFVRLSNQSTDTGKRVAADAVRWGWSTNQISLPYITAISRGLTNTTVTWLAGSSYVYRLQYKTNLADAGWLDVNGDVSATSNTASKVDNTLGNAAQRYYRVLLVQ